MSFHQRPQSLWADSTKPYPIYPQPSSDSSTSSASKSPQWHHGEASRSSRSRSRSHQGPFELSAVTPVRHRSSSPWINQHGLPNKRPPQYRTNALSKKINELDKKSDSVQHNLNVLTGKTHDVYTMCNKILYRLSNLGVTSPPELELGDASISPVSPPFTTLVHPPPRPPPPPRASRASFIAQLRSNSLEYLLAHTDSLDPEAEYAVAPTTNPKDKRCRVGRPKGKILRADQTDDLERDLCAKHKDAEGVRLGMEVRGEGAWVCYPRNERGEDGEGKGD